MHMIVYTRVSQWLLEDCCRHQWWKPNSHWCQGKKRASSAQVTKTQGEESGSARSGSPMSLRNCCSISWLCFFACWLHSQAECSCGMAEMVFRSHRLTPCPFHHYSWRKASFLHRSDKNCGHDLLRRAEVTSLGLKWEKGQSYLNCLESGEGASPKEKLGKQNPPNTQ